MRQEHRFIFLITIISFTIAYSAFAQEKQCQIAVIGFYKLQNLFDTIDSLDKNDNETTKLITTDNLHNTQTNSYAVKCLKTTRSKKNLLQKRPTPPLYTKFLYSKESLTYRDSLKIFDQMIMPPAFLKDTTGWLFFKSYVFNKNYMKNGTGKYKGYLKHFYISHQIQSGYSELFPIYFT